MKHVRLRLLIASAFTLLVAACSQMPTPQVQTNTQLTPQFGTHNEDTGNSVFASRRTGAVYVIGGISRTIDDGSVTRSNTDAFLRRYNSSGTLAWKKTFNATAYEDLTDIAEDAQGNVIVALGKNSGNSEGTSELFKYTSTGRELWRHSLDGVRRVFNLDITSSGGFYIVGDDSDFRTLIRKYDQNGILLWTKQLTENKFFGPSATDAQGNLYTIGTDDKIYKFDQTSKLIWTRSIPKGTADSIYIREIVVDQDTLLLLGDKDWILGETEYGYESETDVMMVKYDLGGKQLWDRSFGTREFDQGISLDVDKEHNIYVAAYLDLSKYQSPVLRKYTPAGRLLEQTTIKNLRQPAASVDDMAVYRAGEFYVTGEATNNLGAGYEGGYSDAFLARIDSEGRRVWLR